MADTTPQQYRAIAKATRAMAVIVFIVAVAVLVTRVALGRPVLPMLPPVLLLCVAGAGLLITSGGAQKKAEGTEGRE